MTHIVLNEEQARVVASTLKPVQVRDGSGNVLGFIAPIWTEEDIAKAKRTIASDQPWYATEQVLAHLRSVERQ